MRVFKYRAGSNRDIDSLVNNEFWAPTREKLNDPYEGVFSRELFEEQLNQLEQIFNVGKKFDDVRGSLKSVLDFTGKSGIYSLSSCSNDELLWAHYSDCHRGFCIEYDLEKLIEFTQNQNYIVPVVYNDNPPHIELSDISDLKNSNDSLLQKMLGTKSKRWEYETEVRIVTSLNGSHSYDYRSVTAVYFGLRMDQDKQDEVMSKLAGRGISYFKIKMGDDYSLLQEQITDPYMDSPEYLYKASPILDSAVTPEYVNEKYKNYTNYLEKAAEIIRRDPYCDAIEFVEFSPEKSTPENPVVLIMCPKCNNRWPRYYLTLNEIDEQYEKIKDLDGST